jgi:hypothetical protein
LFYLETNITMPDKDPAQVPLPPDTRSEQSETEKPDYPVIARRSYLPDEDLSKFTYGSKAARLQPIRGPLTAKAYDLAKSLPGIDLPDVRRFALTDNWRTITKTGHPAYFKKREHCLTLVAKAAETMVFLPNQMLTHKQIEALIDELNILDDFANGRQIKFAFEIDVDYYIADPVLYAEVLKILFDRRSRTIQVTTFTLKEREPPFPVEFGFGKFPIQGIYNENDWEILAAGFRIAAEAFLAELIAWGDDLRPYEKKDQPTELEELVELTTPRRRGPRPPGSFPSPIAHSPALEKRPETPRVVSPVLPPSPTVDRPERSGIYIPPSRRRRDLVPDDHSTPSTARPRRPVSPIRTETTIPKFQQEQVNIRGTPANNRPYDTSYVGTAYQAGGDRAQDVFGPSRPRRSMASTIPEPETGRTAMPDGSRLSSHQVPFTSPDIPSPEFVSYDQTWRKTPSFVKNPNKIPVNQSQNTFTNRRETGQESERQDNSGRQERPEQHQDPDPNDPPGDSDDDGDPDRPGGPPPRRPSRSPARPPGGPGREPPRPPPHQPPDGDPDPPEPPSGSGQIGDKNQDKYRIKVGPDRFVDTREEHFDTKLKSDTVPTWDGDDEKLGDWFVQINEMAARSDSIWVGLGTVAPTRFRGSAAKWWYSVTSSYRRLATRDWDSLKDAIKIYWMTKEWTDRMQMRAMAIYYREPGHGKESPSEYYIRKHGLIELVYSFSVANEIAEIMSKTPTMWSVVLHPSRYTTLDQLQTAIKSDEQLLIKLAEESGWPKNRLTIGQQVSTNSRAWRPYQNKTREETRIVEVKTQAVDTRRNSKRGGWDKFKPMFPKNDSIVSKGKTPEQLNMRPCRWCGSLKHWDPDCEHAKEGAKKARTNFATLSVSAMRAEVDYAEAYEGRLESEDEGFDALEEEESEPTKDQDLTEDLGNEDPDFH